MSKTKGHNIVNYVRETKRKKNYKNNYRKNILCCNCGKAGHIYKKCFQPITSIGIICAYSPRGFNKNNYKKNKVSTNIIFDEDILETSDLKYIFIRRKDSLSFSEIARAKYKIEDENYIKKMLSMITKEEAKFLNNVKSADDIWYKLWWTPKKQTKTRTNEYFNAKKKLQNLIDGFQINNKKISFSSLLKEVNIKWNEPEWGFPKGRRALKESDINCALREFYEETDINRSLLNILPVKPVEEIFTGSNGIKYKHIYYLAYCNNIYDLSLNPKNKHQTAEVSGISWLTPKEIYNKIRENYVERKKLVLYTTKYFKMLMNPLLIKKDKILMLKYLSKQVDCKEQNKNNSKINKIT
jgi:8-oxo-dGTP pyrophosphatase MutT (NUDIX family)